MTTDKITPAGKQVQSEQGLAKAPASDYITDKGSISDIEIQLQRFTKPNGNLTKSISSDKNGNLVKDSSECRMGSGTVKTITVTPKTLPAILENINQNQALALSNIDYSDGRIITTKGKEIGNNISRSSHYFPFVSGPAFLLFDVDTGAGYNPENIEQVLADITKFIPEFEHAAKIIRPSTSSNIHLKESDNEK